MAPLDVFALLASVQIEDGAMTEAFADASEAVQTGSVVIVGSVNADLVVSLDRFPRNGETRIANHARKHFGGKGLSQAIAAARFGSSCALVAAVGQDDNGNGARAALVAAGVDVSGVRSSALPTGQALVWVDDSAENMIVVIRGANAALDTLSEQDLSAIAASRVVLTQFEAGQQIAIAAVRAGREAGATVILNAAPAATIAPDVLAAVDLLIVNEVEVSQLAPGRELDEGAAALAEGCGAVLVTLGSRGGRLYRSGSPVLPIESATVAAVDTTGAGDVCCGVIAAALSQGEPLELAIAFAFAAAALAVQIEGNAASIPSRDQILEFSRLRPTA